MTDQKKYFKIKIIDRRNHNEMNFGLKIDLQIQPC